MPSVRAECALALLRYRRPVPPLPYECLASSTPEDIYLDNDLIWVSRASSAGVHSTTKNNQGRWVIIVDAVRPTLVRLLAAHTGAEDEPLLRGPFGGKWNHSNFEDSVDWPRLVTKLGWPGFRFHDLRGTAISQWLAAGIPLTTAREMAGHASIATTDLYARSASNALTEAKRLADRHIARTRPKARPRRTERITPQRSVAKNREPRPRHPGPDR